MKKIIVLTSLFVTINASAQDIPDDDTTAKPSHYCNRKPDVENS